MAFLDKVLQDSARYYDNSSISLSQIWYGERGVTGGDIYLGYITISTVGNMTSFGSMISSLSTHAVSCSNGYRGLFSRSTFVEYITFSTTSNSSVFGATLFYNSTERCSGSDGIVGVFGSTVGLSYITISTIGTVFNFVGKLIRCVNDVGGCMTDGYKGVFGCYNSYIECIIFANKSDAFDFGNSTVSRLYVASTSNRTRGIISGGEGTNVLDYITLATFGDAVDFGDATVTRRTNSACSNGTRAIFGSSTTTNVMDYVTISTTGNATDFGDMLTTLTELYATTSSGN